MEPTVLHQLIIWSIFRRFYFFEVVLDLLDDIDLPVNIIFLSFEISVSVIQEWSFFDREPVFVINRVRVVQVLIDRHFFLVKLCQLGLSFLNFQSNIYSIRDFVLKNSVFVHPKWWELLQESLDVRIIFPMRSVRLLHLQQQPVPVLFRFAIIFFLRVIFSWNFLS